MNLLRELARLPRVRYRPYNRPKSWFPHKEPYVQFKFKPRAWSAGRDAVAIAMATRYKNAMLPHSVRMTEVEDRRFYHPMGAAAPPGGLNRIASETHRNIIGPHPLIPFKPSERHGFDWRQWKLANRNVLWRILDEQSPENRVFGQPSRLMLCLRRWMRRQMMFASGNAGRDPSQFRRPKRNQFSMVKCLKGVD